MNTRQIIYMILFLFQWGGLAAQTGAGSSLVKRTVPTDTAKRSDGSLLRRSATAETYMQIIDYTWHIRGGLSGINLNGSGSPVPNTSEKDLFSYKLEYETAGQWSGNIGKQSWNHVNGSAPVGVRSYTYTYDNQARLKTAAYSGVGSENYGIPNINYDKNGNITQLQRNGKMGGSFGLMDNLTYTYSGNRLTSVNDAVSGSYEVDFMKRGSGAYTYYANGALKSDENEQITNIVYNTYLNLPEEITLSDGRWIRYTYDGDGTLIKTQYNTGETWEYADGFVFKNGQPYQYGITDGRAIFESGQWKLEFDYKDHLGNTRVSFREGSTGVVQVAKSDFDPWGVRLNGTGMVNSFQNRWELQGKEKEATFNLNRVNFGARVYNPTIGRFDKTDPMATAREWVSTYNYVQNNPVSRIDPDGAFDDYAMKDDGRVELVKRTDDKFDRLTASNGNEIKINKAKSTDGTIISQLSKEDSGGFSMGTTTNATDARNLYNFMDANTTRGIEFGLAGYEDKGQTKYSVSTLHENSATNFNKLNIKPENLIFYIHNHDGPLDNGNVLNASNLDKLTAAVVTNAALKNSRLAPRFFISLENGAMREFFGYKRTTGSNLNMQNINLKSIKKYDYWKNK